MQLTKTAIAGTLESSDIMITIHPHNKTEIIIDLQSTVEKQFGNQIRRVIFDTISTAGVTSAKIVAVDKGAMDCVIRARTKTVISRAMNSCLHDWGGEQ